MKRVSFVSNSSSASFIVTVEKNKSSMVDLLFEHIEDLSYESIKSKLEESLKIRTKALENDKLKLENMDINSENYEQRKNTRKFIIEQDEKLLQRVTDELEELKNFEKTYNFNDEIFYSWNLEEKGFTILTQILSWQGINLKPLYPNSENNWQFSYWTSMFNSYDDIPDVLKKIITIFEFEQSNIKCEVLDD